VATASEAVSHHHKSALSLIIIQKHAFMSKLQKACRKRMADMLQMQRILLETRQGPA
jgi:predicted DNA-binding protein (UPF0251 family)